MTPTDFPPHPDLLYRALRFGADYGELVRQDVGALTDVERFRARCKALADEWQHRARDLDCSGSPADRGHAWRQLACYRHFSGLKLGAAHFREDSQAIEDDSRPYIEELLPTLFGWQVQRVEAPLYRGYRIQAATRPGRYLAWFIGGLDSRKEIELLGIAREWAQAGVDVLILDLPGQGTRFGAGCLRQHFDAAVAHIAERTRQEWGYRALAVIGLSLGGHLALRAAALCDAIGAVVSIGGFHDSRVAGHLPPPVRAHLSAAVEGDAAQQADWLSLQGLRLACPALHVHGSHDQLVDAVQSSALQTWCSSLEWWQIDGAEHVCTSRFGWLLGDIRRWSAQRMPAP